MKKNWKIIFISTAVLISGIVFLISLEFMMHPYAKDGLYFQDWPSETMMQTVSVEDLRDSPLITLLNIHIQPPALDIIRAIFVHVWPSQDIFTSLRHVDFLLYQSWIIVYGLLGLIIFLWLSKTTGIWVAIIAAVVFLLHPASILYATLLETTLLSALLVLLMYYQLWKIKNDPDASITLLIISVLALFFIRSIFQWPFILMIGTSLFLLKVSKRKIMLFLLIVGGVEGLYLGKQYYQFGILSTASFTGLNLANSVGIDTKNYYSYLDGRNNYAQQEESLPAVLTQKKKINGATNFNNILYLDINQQLMDDYKQYLLTTPIPKIVMSYRENLLIYLSPSSRYTTNVIVDRLPWRAFYDHLFSFIYLIGLIILSGIPWLLGLVDRKDGIASFGFILPGVCIILVSILFERGENMRFKFFMEPILYIFIVSQIYAICQRVYHNVLVRRGA